MAEPRKPRAGYRKCEKCGINRSIEKSFKPSGRVCLPCQKKRVRHASRDVRLWETYGITEAEYQAIFEMQGGACAICGGKRTGNLDVDHDHALERAGVPIRNTVRGLLCRRCNRRLLPAAQDSVDRLGAAATYLSGGHWSMSHYHPDQSGRARVQALLAEGVSCS